MTVIDGGAGLNVIWVETFQQLQPPYERLMPTRPFSHVTDGSTTPLGQVRLAITFGSRENFHTELIAFDVEHKCLPYNAILGYPALAKFMAVTHHAYNSVKMLGCTRNITIRCDEKDAMCTLDHAYKAAATAYPADEDEAGPSEVAPTKKKSQFFQICIETKKVSLDGSTSGPFLTIGMASPPNSKTRLLPSSGQMPIRSPEQHQTCPVYRGR
ncbi:uncharacterized protein [Aegilops tauschii subsp. strangulata]|uniref:uncharacterized protein n=1 Tax=Aegilops tauschii subsp. strangulata TaxID=200361 RepID=UPI001ABC9CC9|nr:uncharacterized protein LOC120967007 [Aegilops tauschii subsp. strangulata]